MQALIAWMRERIEAWRRTRERERKKQRMLDQLEIAFGPEEDQP